MNDCPAQIEPLLTVIVGEGLMFTVNDWVGETPQLLEATTVSVPLVALVTPTLIIFVADDPANPPLAFHE